ncbi:MAG: CDP-2,3-bis-(O-geranylgeranyl)-sn-glycerol synthase [Candidatus Methanomethylicia archaeon]|nr:CDP-2,3-bis-(O-geranylgeranyl)-sn-glycerol synthase [Candidatus Methanomethylicia archaeon]MCX8169108.1 CDP-2,3-bis-(O-geranylgeranyl)-sn-glycerol synthase [Candidatus Methanomethylicia archaeon]MDW7988840.1 CDP-2,3-bis-(O-geranylgeranyl)-sn-glycerol synthase [Nitrososphaerota archaeon]
MNVVYEKIVLLIWRILPAYVANAAPVIFVKQGHPLDLNRKFIDGKPIFGSGKTIEGFIIGVFFGVLAGILQDQTNALRAVMLAIGAMLGDVAGSFMKRRLNIGRGKPAPILDQTSFIIGALLLSYNIEKYTLSEIIIIVIITIPIHIISNKIAFMLRIKNVPW